jgi:hypothetical protein
MVPSIFLRIESRAESHLFKHSQCKIMSDRNAALNLYRDGYRTIDDIATVLIGTYVGLSATRINAPTSEAVH